MEGVTSCTLGYSVFAVTSTNVGTDLPRTRADEVAASIPEPSSAQPSSSSAPQKASVDVDMEDEDMDLQAALQASLAHPTFSTSQALPRHGAYSPPHISANREFPAIYNDRGLATSSHSRIHPSGSTIPPNQDPHRQADVDPVTASIQRNRIIMERMRREQEMAFQEQYEEEVSGLGVPRPPRHYGASEEDDDEEGHMRRAIEASLARQQHDEHVLDDDDDDDDDDYQPTPPAEPTLRVYDDDDEALQAALKASLETMPSGFTLPPSPGPHLIERFTSPPPAVSLSEQGAVETASESEDDTSRTESDGPREQEQEELDLEEIRKRRLARFGG